jgi:hypothetical protein
MQLFSRERKVISLIFSMPVCSLPSPAEFINKISTDWLRAVEEIEAMDEAVLVVCPQQANDSDDRWRMNQSCAFYFLLLTFYFLLLTSYFLLLTSCLSNLSTRSLEVWHDKKLARAYADAIRF